MVKNVICLWYNGTAEEAAKFYAQTFPDSAVTAAITLRATIRTANRDRYSRSSLRCLECDASDLMG
jgi:predicted 3-demethylubiquinone-9 3-methyltransferase (glyoxalase superfamily)